MNDITPIDDSNQPMTEKEVKSIIRESEFVDRIKLSENIGEIELDIEIEDIKDFCNSLSYTEVISLLDGDDGVIKRAVERFKLDKAWKQKFWSKDNSHTHQSI